MRLYTRKTNKSTNAERTRIKKWRYKNRGRNLIPFGFAKDGNGWQMFDINSSCPRFPLKAYLLV